MIKTVDTVGEYIVQCDIWQKHGSATAKKIKFPDGSIVEAVIWELPEPTEERPHGFKYRLNYSAPDGTTLVRYDNELGKGEHKHFGDEETGYTFQNTDALLDDFWRDVAESMEMERHE